MIYIFRDVKLSDKKKARTGLRAIFGIGLKKSSYLCDVMGLSQACSMRQISRYKYAVLVYIMKKYYITETGLKRLRYNRLKRFTELRSYKSIKFLSGLPIRGQRTRTNAQTRKNIRYAVKRQLKK